MYLHMADMLLHMLLTICDGLRVGSSTTSTISAPRGSSSISTLCVGGGGGGGGGDVSTGTEVTLFKALGLALLVFDGSECLVPNLVLSVSSSELSTETEEEDDTPLSCEDFCDFLTTFSSFCGFGRNSLDFFVSFLSFLSTVSLEGATLTTTLQPEFRIL